MARIPHQGKVLQSAFVAAFVLCAAFVAPGALSQEQSDPKQGAAIPSAGRLDYDVTRKGEKIGTHSVTFRHDGRHLTTVTRTDISVKLLGVTLYRFHYEAYEQWADDRLRRLTSRTDNDGKILTVRLARVGTRIRGTCNGVALDLPADRLPISVWHPEFVHQTIILDQYKCVERTIRTTDEGLEQIFTGARSVATRHYAITGQLQRDVWLGPGGQVVQVRFPAKDASQIVFVARSASQLPQSASSSSIQRTR
jgi:hypothetical protein